MSPGEPLERVEEALEISSSGDVQNLLFLLSVATSDCSRSCLWGPDGRWLKLHPLSKLLSFLGDLHHDQHEPFLWHTYKTAWDLRVHLTQIFQTSNITLIFAKRQLPGS